MPLIQWFVRQRDVIAEGRQVHEVSASDTVAGEDENLKREA